MFKINDATQKWMTDSGLLVIRLMVGTVFVFHGSQKLFGMFGGAGIEGFAGFLTSLGIPLPTLSAYLAGSSEFFGGLLLIAGVGVRLVGIPLAFTMLVAAFTVGQGFENMTGGNEYPLTLAAVVTGLGLIGPGRLTLIQAFGLAKAPQRVAATV